MTDRRFVVLDRDGTIIEERHYLSDPRQVELIPGAGAGLRLLSEMGLGLVVITNQSGVGRGLFDQARLNLVHRRLCELLEGEGVYLNGIYSCPHRPEENCSCRKPQTQLLELAAKEHGFDLRECFVIGDKATDIEVGRRVGGTTFLVKTGYGAKTLTETVINPGYVVEDLWAAARVIQTLLTTRERKVTNVGSFHFSSN